jgi:phosphoglycolate phosphatase
MKKINFNIIFDLDGTLVHSVPDMHHAINKTLTKYNLKNISEKKLQTFVGEGMLTLSKKVVDFCGGDKGLYEEIFNSYRQNYSEQPYKYSTLMPGVMETLNFFYERKILMGICTNKRQFVTEKLIKQMSLDKFFDVIIGAQDNIPLKPKPDMIQLTINKFNSTKSSFFMVGDTSNDVDAAKSANIKSIAVNGGYTHVDINSLGADYTLETMEEIIELFESFKLGPN